MSVPLIQDHPIDRGESCEKYIYLNASVLSDTYYVLHFDFIVTKLHFMSKAYAHYYLSVRFPSFALACKLPDLESKALLYHCCLLLLLYSIWAGI